MKFNVRTHTAQYALRGRQREARAGFRRKAFAKIMVRAAGKKKAAGKIHDLLRRGVHGRKTRKLDNHGIWLREMIDIGVVVNDGNKAKYESDMAALLDAKRVIVRYSGTIGANAGEKLRPQNRVVLFEVWSWRNRSHPSANVMDLWGAYINQYVGSMDWPKSIEETAAASTIVKAVRPHAHAAIKAKKIIDDWFFGNSEFCPTCYKLGEGDCGNCCVSCHAVLEGGEYRQCAHCDYEDACIDTLDYCGGCGYHAGTTCGCR